MMVVGEMKHQMENEKSIHHLEHLHPVFNQLVTGLPSIDPLVAPEFVKVMHKYCVRYLHNDEEGTDMVKKSIMKVIAVTKNTSLLLPLAQMAMKLWGEEMKIMRFLF